MPAKPPPSWVRPPRNWDKKGSLEEQYAFAEAQAEVRRQHDLFRAQVRAQARQEREANRAAERAQRQAAIEEERARRKQERDTLRAYRATYKPHDTLIWLDGEYVLKLKDIQEAHKMQRIDVLRRMIDAAYAHLPK